MIVPLPRTLKKGMQGKDVLAVQRAMAHAKYRKWGVLFTGRFGPGLKEQIKRFQRDHGLHVDGVYGLATHRVLAKYFDRYGATLMIRRKRFLDQQENEAQGANAAVQAALILYNNRWHCRYTQSSARMMIVRHRIKDLAGFFRRGGYLWEDCSSSVTGFYYIAGLPDPNGNRYNGDGYTGTLAYHGNRVASPRPGDLGFYGWSPYRHVVICVGNNRCVSFGSNPPKLLSPYYRSDFSHWRRYG